VPQTNSAPAGRRAFSKVSDAPWTIRCQTHQALVDAVSYRDSMYARNAVDRGQSKQRSSGVHYKILPSDRLPFCGQQEIRFFDASLGLIISDFTLTHDFNYEFVYEDLGFIQFRTGDTLARRSSGRRQSVISLRPSFKVSVAPADHVENIHYVGNSRWETITAFFDLPAIERLLDFDDDAVRDAAARLGGWQQHFGTSPQNLTVSMLEALRAVRACPYTGALRRAFLEAKTTELICLSLGLAVEPAPGRGEVRLSSRVRCRLDQARAMLDADSVNPPTLSELASKVGVNRRTLVTGFKQLFHKTVYQYFLANRMAEAKLQLADGGVTIAQVANFVGYSDQATFSRAFHRFYGQPPSHYLPGRF
jgi:AraC-like DNA-binding protein